MSKSKKHHVFWDGGSKHIIGGNYVFLCQIIQKRKRKNKPVVVNSSYEAWKQ
jgi:hypothetical protein